MLSRSPGILLIAASLFWAGCATERLNEPEPTLLTPGAFVAEGTEGEPLELLRVLDTFKTEQDTVLALTVYNVEPHTFDEARLFARLPSLPIRTKLTAASANLLTEAGVEVVWYRTLTDEERERAE